MTRRRIGIFGGTFDPVHLGHIEVAVRVRALLSLDRVDFLPAYRPPHKRELPVADAWHRFAMLVLATEEHEGLFVSTLELETRRLNYTIDTIARLQRHWGEMTQLFFIMGADSFEEITTWKAYEQLLGQCHFVVMTRPGHPLRTDHLPPSARHRIVDLREGSRPMESPSRYQIYLCGGVESPISSTQIRQALKTGQPVRGLAPAVRRHIEKYQLYRNAHEARTETTDLVQAGRTR